MIFQFNGTYRRDLQTDNWHFWEDENGEILHISKSSIESVFGDSAEKIIKNRSQSSGYIDKYATKQES